MPKSVEAALAAGRLLAFDRDRKLPVVHVQHLATRLGSAFFIPGSPGVVIHLGVLPLPGEKVVQKRFPDSFRDAVRDRGDRHASHVLGGAAGKEYHDGIGRPKVAPL
ncbi:MAG TPA: isochorismatase family protein [Candidatus Brocadiia bacterium]|nr:isochorismatase family protein [Candidatus Brocadiia bacterium]